MMEAGIIDLEPEVSPLDSPLHSHTHSVASSSLLPVNDAVSLVHSMMRDTAGEKESPKELGNDIVPKISSSMDAPPLNPGASSSEAVSDSLTKLMPSVSNVSLMTAQNPGSFRERLQQRRARSPTRSTSYSAAGMSHSTASTGLKRSGSQEFSQNPTPLHKFAENGMLRGVSFVRSPDTAPMSPPDTPITTVETF